MINDRRLIALVRTVIGMNSENPPGREKALARFIEKDMRTLGLAVKTHAFAKGRPNVVATIQGRLPRRRAAREALLLTPHMDTVPIGRGWKYRPLAGEVRNGRIYGRGATDDKGNLACCLEVMRSLIEDRVPLKRDVIMAATVDEETGSHQGIIPLLEKGILRPAYALILDSDECDAIIAQKGLLHCRVRIMGKKAHGAYIWRGVNAIELAASVIAALKRHRFAHKSHSLLRGPTVNVGVIQGGDKVNMVADFCEFALDVRFLPGMRVGSVLSDIRRIIRQRTKTFKIVIDDIQQPYEMDFRHPLVQTYVSSARQRRVPVQLKGSEGATVMTFFRRHRIPAFATGFGAKGTAHTTDEYARVATLVKGARVLETFVKRFDAR